jgi:hypothetical protein
MTTKADERLNRLEGLVDRLEVLIPDAVLPAPTSVNPDGSPGPVAPGELIESAWGNAVSNELQRTRAWFVQNTNSPTFTTTASDFPGLTLTHDFKAGKIYKISAFVAFCIATLDGVREIFITDGNSQALNRGANFTHDGFSFSLHTQVVVSTSPVGVQTVKVMMRTSAGVLSVTGGAGQQSNLIIEEISP